MKWNRLFRLLLVTAVFILFSLIIPVSPVQAAFSNQSVYPNSGPVGSSVTVSGTATANNTFYVRFGTYLVATGTTNATTGAFTASFSVPTLPRFSYYVNVSTTTDAEISFGLFQITPQVGLSSGSGYVGDQITVSGNGFNSSSSISIYFDNDVIGTTTSNSDGTFASTSFTVPASARGSHTVKGRDSSGDSSVNPTFTVNQKMSVSPASSAVADKITVSGTGFATNSNFSSGMTCL
jgi:hypothetical protein